MTMEYRKEAFERFRDFGNPQRFFETYRKYIKALRTVTSLPELKKLISYANVKAEVPVFLWLSTLFLNFPGVDVKNLPPVKILPKKDSTGFDLNAKQFARIDEIIRQVALMLPVHEHEFSGSRYSYQVKGNLILDLDGKKICECINKKLAISLNEYLNINPHIAN